MTRIAFVVARDRRGVIGKDGRLPWRLPDDMRHVRELTMGKPLIMGRRTFESIGRPLVGRTNIVLTRDPAFRCEGCLVARSPDQALALVRDAPEVIVFGGAGVFRDFLPLADRIYMTEVDAEVSGDTYFPPLDMDRWRETARQSHAADARHSHPFAFVTLERVR
ncbi:MAG TPA: dihydrofolate reductase [Candidatus Limnocylindria bacterium]|nr:dihydrofolate reductase [Candidatus Limnocylindria bacterium]